MNTWNNPPIQEAVSDGNAQSAELTVPADIRTIEACAYENRTDLRQVNIENGVECINENAFAGCGALTEIVLPDSVKGVHAGAFRNCVSLERAVLPRGVRSIDAECFAGCVSLREIEIPADVIVIGDGAFRGCDSLERVVICGERTAVYQTAFEACMHLSARSARAIAERLIKPLKFDIKPNAKGIGGRLSPFAKREFVFDGVVCGCIESVLQSFRFPDPQEQAAVCAMDDGRAARNLPSEYEWRDTATLFWRGVPYSRDGAEYQALLDRLFQSVYEQDPVFRRDVGFLCNAQFLIKSYTIDPAAAPVTSREIRIRLTALCESCGDTPLHTEYEPAEQVIRGAATEQDEENTPPPAPPENGESRVVVLGGSFNPPTIAHLRLLIAAKEAVNANAGVFVPSNDAYVTNKMKKNSSEAAVLPEQLRLSMLRAMCGVHSGLSADDCEFGKDANWRTYETMCELQKRYPSSKLYFVMGADKLHILPWWRHKQLFLSNFRILAVSRENEDPEQLIRENSFLNRNRNAFSFMEAPEGLDGISSSAVREALLSGSDTVKDMLHPVVLELLRQHDAADKPIRCFDGEYGFLSNFYEAPVTCGGLTYPTSEAAYQAQKTLSDEERVQFTTITPGKAKRLGNKVTLRPDWEDVKLGLMEEIVRAKFTQHPDIAECLLATGDRELIEGNNWHDTYWGVDLDTGQGENHLGRILMQIRQELKN